MAVHLGVKTVRLGVKTVRLGVKTVHLGVKTVHLGARGGHHLAASQKSAYRREAARCFLLDFVEEVPKVPTVSMGPFCP